MTRAERITLLAQAIGADIKQLKLTQGDVSALNTTAKDNITNAINEVLALSKSANNIDDSASGVSNKTWSANKIGEELQTSINNLRKELKAGASDALDTFAELASALGDNPNFATTIANGLAKRVRVDDAQTFSTTEKKQACENIGIGDPDHDFVADYNTAKA